MRKYAAPLRAIRPKRTKTLQQNSYTSTRDIILYNMSLLVLGKLPDWVETLAINLDFIKNDWSTCYKSF